MKSIKTIFVLFVLFTSGLFYGQTSSHPTISEVKVSYKADPASSGGLTNIQVVPQTTITLTGSGSVNKIYLQIVDESTNSIVYDVNYLIGSGVVNSASGSKLFENVNGQIFISSGQLMGLKPYTYKVYTQDSQGNSTAIFSVVQ